MRNDFDNQLEKLHVELICMGAMCEEAIQSAVKYLLENKTEMAQKASLLEHDIDEKEREIEHMCMKLLLKQQPVARDLRAISSALKMISDMERIGDQAADMAEAGRYITDDKLIHQVDIEKMSVATTQMLTKSIDSFVKRDIELAKQVMKDDDLVDDYFLRIKSELIDLMVRNPEYGESLLELLMIAKYLEKIGDHACNIAEWVVYSVTGEHV